MLYGRLIPTEWVAGQNFEYERVYLTNDEKGKIVLDVAKSLKKVANSEPEKVMVLLHGVAGSS